MTDLDKIMKLAGLEEIEGAEVVEYVSPGVVVVNVPVAPACDPEVLVIPEGDFVRIQTHWLEDPEEDDE